MRYVLLLYTNPADEGGAVGGAGVQEFSAFCRTWDKTGAFRAASPLHPAATGQCVRSRHGKILVTPGPYVETTEQLQGVLLIDVDNLDEAISVAAQVPGAKQGTVEVRPIVELTELPPGFRGERDPQLKPFMLLCYDHEAAWNEVGSEALRAAMMEAVQITHELAALGRYRFASPLQPVSMATSVRIRDGRTMVTDGPFAETREFLGGFYWIYATDYSEAITVAARHPGQRFGGVEARMVYPIEGLPERPLHPRKPLEIPENQGNFS